MQESNDEECFQLFVPKERCLLPHQHKECIPQIDASLSLKQTMKRMRQCKNKGLRHTLWWEIGVSGSVLRSACSLSLWADHFLQTAIIQAEHLLHPQFGHMEGGRFCIIGLTKLGGVELNLKSHLNLLFIWDSPSLYSNGAEKIPAQDFYTRKAKLIIQMMSEVTEDGLVWPVDMQLRPEGQTSPICQNLSTTLNHYHHHGKTWERMMLTKARAVAGNLDLADQFIEKVQPFIYRAHMDYSTIQDLTDMKNVIDTDTQKAPTDIQTGFNIKYGKGSIREIEFTVQSLQLLHAKRYPQLQLTNSMDTLAALQNSGLLSNTKAQELHRSYVVWRMIEHALQARLGEQNYFLENDYESYLFQARRLECPTLIMQKHANITHRYFAEQFNSVVQHEAPNKK